MQSIVSASTIESALYRAMDIPGLRTLYPRPPAEAQTQLNALLATNQDAQLYALRAHVDEDALDFTAAEQDWKAFAAHSVNKPEAQFQLADFYHRRNAGPQEIAALEAAAASPPTSEKFLAADQQQAWQAFPRALSVAQDQALGDDATLAIDKSWLTRYPTEPSVRAIYIATLLKLHRFDDAQHAIDDYKTAFPQDAVFPIKAAALLALDQNNPNATTQALALFDKSYRPLWDSALVSTYFELLSATHTQHAFLATTRAQLQQNPDDLLAAAKLFDYYQQQGHLDAAINSLAEYGVSKESRHASWSPDELYTFATLLNNAAQYQDAARYDYALASTPGHLSATQQSPEEAGLTGLIQILLSAPNQSIALGAGNLSLYSDIATIDRGPGALNGILSLWLNSQQPAYEFSNEEDKATPYFHRAKAAELLAQLDQRFPASTARPDLHAQLIQAYIAYGQDAAVKQAAQQFLTDFPQARERLAVALELADVYARTGDTHSEFALYDSLLTELSAPLQGMSLSASSTTSQTPGAPSMPGGPFMRASAHEWGTTDADTTTNPAAPTPSAADLLQQSLNLPITTPPTQTAAAEYRQILERYLGRLTTTNQLPAALTVLRRELDRNPNDPQFYERLATFLQQNKFAAQEEEVYQRALTRFNDTSFYDKLARFYLRQKRNADFDALTRKIVDIFSGTDLDQYFANVHYTEYSSGPNAQEALQLNLYAHRRFPHDLVFTRNLLDAYQQKSTADPAAWEHLLREHWQDAPDLQARFFDYLRINRKLDAELTALQALVPTAIQQLQDPAASRELAEIHLWQSHFEQSAPLLGQLAGEYPSDIPLGDEAVSVFRSLAYFDPAQVTRAAAIEQHLSTADPTNLDRLATLGDIYAGSTATSLNLDATRQLAQAAPFWQRMATVHPGTPDGYLQSATIFWDYFQFDPALAQIEAARKRFNNPALYGYEAGAIYENKRDLPHAIAEYVQAAILDPVTNTNSRNYSYEADAPNSTDSDADTPRQRLLELLPRPQLAPLIDQATAKAVADNPTIPALDLRLTVLKALHRQSDIAPVVAAAIAHATTIDTLAQLADFSQQHQLPLAYQSALQREIALTVDPVQHIELQYDLAHAFEDQKDIPAAQRIIESIYTANPKLIGVVRTTTDFYWNDKQQAHAITTLIQAAHDANPSLAHDFTLEAIDKSNQSADYAGARTLLKPLRAADPFNPQYLNLEAESYSLAHDNAGLRDLYTTTIAALKTAPLAQLDKRDKIALARQGLIPALTNLKDYAGAIDQHIALISAFPEDPNILQTATSYARLHSRESQLVDFLDQTVAASPRDSRFAIDLARVDMQFEDYAGALAAYSKAIAIRADRPDLYIARADLEEHQQSFDAACADYDRLYLLTYKDPQWMEKAALARARQGKPDLAVKALQAAWLDGHPADAEDYFRVAEQLEAWNLLPQADTFAAQAVNLAGDNLLTTSHYSDGAIFYARLLARERKAPQAFTFFAHLRDAAPAAPALIAQQIEKKGFASVTDSDWRTRYALDRHDQAQLTYRQTVQQISSVVAEFYTPEEKSAFASLLDAQRANRSAPEVLSLWIPAAVAAGLKDREVLWRRDLLLQGGEASLPQLAQFNQLETARMDFTPLAETLDTYAPQLKEPDQLNVLAMAAEAWRNAGNLQRETRDLSKLVLLKDHEQFQQRLFDIYLHSDTAALLELTTSENNKLADASANYLLAHSTQAMANQAIANRAANSTPIWNSATSALVGLYFGDTSPQVDADFETALADETIGQRLATKPDATKQLVGNLLWFYYGTRYGFFLTLSSKPTHDPEDFLSAQLEAAPNDPASFNALAQTYLDAHNTDAAILEYRHVSELNPTDPAPDIDIAEALWSANRRDDAFAAYRDALTKLRVLVDLHAVPETFWTSFSNIATDAGQYQIGSQLKPEMNTVLEAYIHKNDSYRTSELLQSAYTSLEKQDNDEAAAWVLALIDNAGSESQPGMIDGLTQQQWFPKSHLDTVYQREIALAQANIKTVAAKPIPNGGTANYELDSARSRLTTLQTTYVQWLLQHDRSADAQRIFDSISITQRNTGDLIPIAIRLAAKQSRIPALLAGYLNDPTAAPSLETLSTVANTLRLQHDNPNSRLLLEYVFQQKLQQQILTDPDYLALAEARLNTNDTPGALDLLHRLTLQGDLYQNLDTAASLLVRTGHNAEALPLLTELTNGTPWNATYRLRLGQCELALKQSEAPTSLTAVASSDQADYATRATAAEDLQAISTTTKFSSAELTLLAATTPPTPQQADQHYFLYARIAAATIAPPPQSATILRAAIQTAPDPMLQWLRLRLFQAEIAQDHYQQANVAIAPVLAGNYALRFTPTQDQSDQDATTDDDTGDQPRLIPPATNPYTVLAALPTPEDQLTFALAVATMSEHLGNDYQALKCLKSAVRFTSNSAQKSELDLRIKTLQARIDLANNNASRRPVIQESLQQTARVQPRLTAPTPEKPQP